MKSSASEPGLSSVNLELSQNRAYMSYLSHKLILDLC